jgi:hypothetical protein
MRAVLLLTWVLGHSIGSLAEGMALVEVLADNAAPL